MSLSILTSVVSLVSVFVSSFIAIFVLLSEQLHKPDCRCGANADKQYGLDECFQYEIQHFLHRLFFLSLWAAVIRDHACFSDRPIYEHIEIKCAWTDGLEPPTFGFGDRRSTN